jgi:hypothetical protein
MQKAARGKARQDRKTHHSLATLPNGRMAYVPESSANSLQVQMAEENGGADTRFGAGGYLIAEDSTGNFSYRTGLVRYIGGGWMYIVGMKIDATDAYNPQFVVYKVAIN